MAITILWRRGAAATWASVNPTLGSGEIGFETNTGKFKIGDGTTAWNSLAYANAQTYPGSGIAVSTGSAWGSSITDNHSNWDSAYTLANAGHTNWDTAYTQRLQWDGGSTNLVAATGRTSLGLGTIATQAANNVNLTGGSASLTGTFAVTPITAGTSTFGVDPSIESVTWANAPVRVGSTLTTVAQDEFSHTVHSLIPNTADVTWFKGAYLGWVVSNAVSTGSIPKATNIFTGYSIIPATNAYGYAEGLVAVTEIKAGGDGLLIGAELWCTNEGSEVDAHAGVGKTKTNLWLASPGSKKSSWMIDTYAGGAGWFNGISLRNIAVGGKVIESNGFLLDQSGKVTAAGVLGGLVSEPGGGGTPSNNRVYLYWNGTKIEVWVDTTKVWTQP